MRTAILALALLGALVLLHAADRFGPVPEPPRPASYPAADPDPAHRDLEAIVESGELRILVPTGAGGRLITPAEESLIERFARARNLEPVWLGLPWNELYDALRDGEGDVALNAPARDGEPGVRYTRPWGASRYQVVARAGTGRIRSEEELYLREIAVKRNSPEFVRLAGVARKQPGMRVVPVPEHTTLEKLLEGVATGRYDVAVADSMSLEPLLSRFLNLQAAYDLTQDDPRSWAVREESKALLAALNRYLDKRHLEMALARVYRADLPELRERKTIRLVTYPGASHYYFDSGGLRGFEYEMVRSFAEANGMRLDVVIASSHAELRRLLLEGRGDIIAASLPVDSYAGDSELAYTQPYLESAPVLVGRAGEEPILDLSRLEGRRIVLPPESPYRAALTALRESGIAVEIVNSGPGINLEGTLFHVSEGLYDLTVIGSHQAAAELSRHINLEVKLTLGEPAPLAWAVRRGDTELHAALNDYLGRTVKSGLFNVLQARYLQNPPPLRGDVSLLTGTVRLSPYDAIITEFADRYGFDWRLIAAQIFQESRFDPAAESYAGAQGLMQIVPSTAELIGLTDPEDPRSSIEAGVRYLDYLRSKFEDHLLLEDRTWFTLAAYNAGFERVRRARRKAAQMGLDQDRWFNNVEKAMLAMARPYERDGEIVRDCRCGQTVVYVRDIRTRYNNYVRLTQSVQMAAAERLGDSRI